MPAGNVRINATENRNFCKSSIPTDLNSLVTIARISEMLDNSHGNVRSFLFVQPEFIVTVLREIIDIQALVIRVLWKEENFQKIEF
ncbi:hypothetical protein TNCT_271591 [Trichonephila clavata]|uniref:Uncharacterized protein n=1 Tax=Trichonephila clavata TaxID=2740835 RepID=A0A8X6L7R0_TRICU|nr:hypothetical protein TNCT_271591 [Trichonephila clavata]